VLVLNLLGFFVCFFIVLKAVDYAIKYSTLLARIFGLDEFVISFFVVAVISALPESVISILANIEGKQEVAVMTLIGGNVVDLTFVFGVIALFAYAGVKIESHIMKKDAFYLVLLVLPLLLAIDGKLSRPEGVVLMISGLLFFYTLSVEKKIFEHTVSFSQFPSIVRALLLLAVSLGVMLFFAHWTIKFLSLVALDLGVPELIVALFIIATGTCLPELLFGIQSVRSKHDSLALGNILGVVIIDSTIVLGLLAIIRPIVLEVTYLQVITFFNALGACVLFYYIRKGQALNRGTGIMLLAFYVVFVVVQLHMQFS
jgi:cation:H+ antiporter